jgi:hypothetical protein
MDKLKIRNELENQQAWRIGLYVYEAMSVVMYNAFKKEGQPPQTYCEKPYDFNGSGKTEEERREEEIQRNEELIKENLRRGKKALKEQGYIEGEMRWQTTT